MKRLLLLVPLIALVLIFASHYSSLWLGHSDQSRGEPGPDQPAEAREWRALAWRDENGDIPNNPIGNAITARDEYLSQQEATDGFSNGAVARMNWVPRGPTNVGGRTRSVIIHPTDTSIMWAGSVGGGVWKSTDGGANWFSSNGNIQNFAVCSMAMDPRNSNVIYAGTGEGFGNNDFLAGNGIYKSVDGGTTWEHLETTDPANNLTWRFVNRIALAYDENDNLIILAATSLGIMRSVNEGAWTKVQDAISRFVAFDPSNSQNAIAEAQACGFYNTVPEDN